MPSNVPADQPPVDPSWVELVHRLRWAIAVVGLAVYVLVPSEPSDWLRALIFLTSMVGFWIRDVVDWWRRKRAIRPL